jgi:hypothetical protein
MNQDTNTNNTNQQDDEEITGYSNDNEEMGY